MLNFVLKFTTLSVFNLVANGQEDGNLRLVDGSHSREGRLEIFHNGIWGGVCDDNFGYYDASVACRQLGFRCLSDVQFYTQGGYTSYIWMDDVGCNGLETSLNKCSHNGWGSHNCGTGENVGIRCFGGCEGDLWLVGGSSYGRLHIYHSGSWGTICDDAFGSADALVVCKQLQLRTTAVQFYTAGNGNGTIWLDDVACNGQENRLDYCNHIGWSVHNCGHHEDVGINCYGGYSFSEVNGNWGSWSDWTICSSSCDSGHQTRSRICNNPVPSPNGAYCNGKSFEVLNCSIARCTVNGNWGSWSDWTVCSSSCDSGHQTRSRLCNNPVPSSSGSYCNGKSFGVLNCSIARCAVDGSWGGWSKWSDCNATCDGGVQKRTRTCNNPYPSAGGSACSGMADQILICAESDCPVLGAWSEWGVWSLCSTSCGSGNRTRNRLCDNPPPSYGGEYCNGKTLDSDTCNTHECPINGNWGSWLDWTVCSSSCDSGYQTRARLCNSPMPSSNGAYCNGKSWEVLNCSTAMCTVNGNWGSWSDWTICSSSCDSGHQTRSRICNNPVPSSNGAYCYGKSFEVLNCSIARCIVDGSWGEWSKWSDCNATCDGGVQKRTRICNNPYPSAGGSACSGMADQILICAESHCPVIGAWSEWGVWSLCSASCGSGNRTRSRQCDNPLPSYGGAYCNGKTFDSDKCNTHECPTDNCLCFNGGKCVTSNDGKVVCDCIGQWTGEFCLESQCMTYDCGFGNCLVEPMNGTAQCVCGNKQPTYCTENDNGDRITKIKQQPISW
ncbi:Hemicentin-1,Neurotrypsin,Coadhesin,Adhesion G protein-coupled receptor B3,Thrombospondin-2,Adhesion G protein-coupled receptor B2,Scavenger receptor cysteine-rich domain-containing group B protein,Mucin-like protein,Scavenger receptor cysteine-rich type 1 protein M160,Scavenger receptor cysteine-rich type 1 protein M130,A disintegrin and metalloproteinase with thrombospondin motifs adt-1,Soluble scavenger receptor cysteine-rich domain-containing protein SSC5D,Adhesion G protein-coupled receptor B1,Thrombo|uniref:Uncharacterized protein n=1 Tax=Mytilus edulis TaxID=6550 RepID=A0A8S3QC57_MYTED|nr:Hemicentin-1,Neurotrypsin,Coadhesin,Adhesion G protein-coupled receptor B3,Thrombospondin-2,Adhesion G protein-coupled receptor B2,Scavenger receptor cysteine-rich domain-containing group B protein,Mucin-like protein,Scavenger receptor cysteine-rich type 1 protein M160,Scavenger receptor cysteine-rich type 1 protein M130,A disintegrin and metalloproteinase with thrombospondin motifs adt-1,Soluble scavenger receptor cysteine-rich domain-containing protein SSC5D,Adhesion G protein-coupled receptor